jgi:ribosomal protein S18 acetylase RimI-like enzyme
MEIIDDGWLTNIFGYPVFRIDVSAPDEPTSQIAGLIKRHASERPTSFYYAKVDTKHIEVVRQLGSAGLYVVDVNVTFSIDVKVPSSGSVPGETAALSIREVEDVDHDAVLKIAGTCFRYSRFHLDPLVPLAVANRIKRDWIESYIKKRRGERLFAALKNNMPVGFLAVIESSTNGRPGYTIDLIGVAPDSQGQGIGRALTLFFIDHYQERATHLRVGTQAANIPSMRLYQKLGFFVSQTQYVMHGHFGAGA